MFNEYSRRELRGNGSAIIIIRTTNSRENRRELIIYWRVKINYGFHFFPRYVSIINRRIDENSFKKRQRRLIWRHIVKRRRNYFKKRKKEKMLSFHEIKKIIKLCRIIINQRDIIKRISRIKFSLFLEIIASLNDFGQSVDRIEKKSAAFSGSENLAPPL